MAPCIVIARGAGGSGGQQPPEAEGFPEIKFERATQICTQQAQKVPINLVSQWSTVVIVKNC